MAVILHIADSQHLWDQARKLGFYRPSAFEIEGFIHCAKPDQLAGVIERYYKAVRGLFVLEIEEAKVQAPVKYENLTGGTETFPHIYGPLNIDAVQRTFLMNQ